MITGLKVSYMAYFTVQHIMQMGDPVELSFEDPGAEMKYTNK